MPHYYILGQSHIPNRPRTFCAKRFFNLQRTIFRYADICFTGFAVPYALPHLLQTVFRPKRFASFRPLLYQRFKVNFLPPNLSPKFH